MRTGFLILARRPVCPQCVSSLGIKPFRRLASNSKIGPFRRGLRQEKGLPKAAARTRFAPSPTGYLHLGSLRTALFNYLLARSTGGQFLLRLEDTDRSRLVPDAEKRLYDDLKWTGLEWDEGPDIGGKFGPYRQSERNAIYHSHVETLIEKGKAYRCFCSPADLEQHKAAAHANGLSTHYPGTCREIPHDESNSRRDEPHAVRFKSSATPVEFHDLVYNRYKKADAEEDYVLVKRDGFPTYHFANVVDDHLMEITHVVRGAEWLISTPKHIELYQAFGWTPPQFAHLGLLVNKDGQKLSKRHGGFDIEEYKRAQKILPSTLLNFAALHGWKKRGLKSDIMTLDTMIERFDLGCSKGDITVTFDKLDWLEDKHRKIVVHAEPPNMPLLSELWLESIRLAVLRLDKAVSSESTMQSSVSPRPHRPLDELKSCGELVHDFQHGTSEHIEKFILKALRISSKLPETRGNLEDWINANKHLFWSVTADALGGKLATIPFSEVYIGSQECDLGHAIQYFIDIAKGIQPSKWGPEYIDNSMMPAVKGVFFQDANTNELVRAGGSILLRWALAEGDHGPTLAAIMDLLGKEETIARLRRAYEVATSLQHRTVPRRQDGMLQPNGQGAVH